MNSANSDLNRFELKFSLTPLIQGLVRAELS